MIMVIKYCTLHNRAIFFGFRFIKVKVCPRFLETSISFFFRSYDNKYVIFFLTKLIFSVKEQIKKKLREPGQETLFKREPEPMKPL